MIDIKGSEYYAELLEILYTSQLDIPSKMKRVKFLFERLCRQMTSDQPVQFPNFFSRLSWVQQHLLTGEKELSKELNLLRISLSHAGDNDEVKLRQVIGVMSRAVRFFLNEPVPGELIFSRDNHQTTLFARDYMLDARKRMRARFVSVDEEGTLLVVPEDKDDNEPVRVRLQCDKNGRNPFEATLEVLHENAQVNLLQVEFDERNKVYVADLIVLEPDFLMDISSVADCFRDYGAHPLNYIYRRITPDQNTKYILLGNIANQFLDDVVNETPEQPADYMLSMKKSFAQSPVAIASCPDLEDKQKAKEFFMETRQQFDNIRKVVGEMFDGNGIDRHKALLEPSFVCEALGLQGRLDLLQQDYTKFIELKSGKANQDYYTKEISHKEPHYVQMMLYYAVLRYNLDIRPDQIDAYLLYSKYPILYRMSVYWGLVRRTIDLRNQIVALEYRIQQHNDIDYTREILKGINSEALNLNGLKGKLWNDYLRRDIDNFADELLAMSQIESDYFMTLFNFIAKEQYTCKAGDTDTEVKRGVTMLWNATLSEREEAGEIIVDLRIRETRNDKDKFVVVLDIPQVEKSCIPNFRPGDGVLLYRRDDEKMGVSNGQVLKMSIEEIDSRSMKLTSRYIQKNASVLPPDSVYAIERDYMDSAFGGMMQGLASFMGATSERKSLILSQRIPRIDRMLIEKPLEELPDVERIVEKSYAARDYFLLVGPPGTGKTSYALRRMVERFMEKPGTNILMLAYTNKAVDEICRSLVSISEDLPFLRIGQESACEDAFKPRLMKNVMDGCMKRQDVYETLQKYRIFVSTISSMSRQTNLFRLKSFDVAIVDEATQILEPQMLGLLSARDAAGRDAIRKFILIGDYKQLPAVVVQKDEDAGVKSELLRQIGINSMKESLFERLFRHEQKMGRTDFCDMLTRQGRMHPEICDFPNRFFYHGRLLPIPLPHQQEIWDGVEVDVTDVDSMVAGKRMAFFPVFKRDNFTSNKINPEEAGMVVRLLRSWMGERVRRGESFDLADNVGIITPYRSQIAMIRKELQDNDIEGADRIVIDTVERFQGGQRDLMIYSCCMNSPYQMNFLSNTIEEDGKLIDRKLNVALTRARKQMFIVGNPEVLRRDAIYRQLLEYIKGSGGWYCGER